jgi:hypothetical protein
MNGLDTFYGIPQESHTTGFTVACVVLAVVFAALGAWFYARARKTSLRSEQHTPKDDGGSRTSSHQDMSQSRDAYTILGVRRGASFDEIRRAYRERMKEYHPDKVAGLGAELRELAERKAKEINMAFEELKRTNGTA